MHALDLVPTRRPKGKVTRQVLLADPDPIVRGWLKPVLRPLTEVVEVTTGEELETALLHGDTVGLVVTNARLHTHSALQSLARVRASGASTPFIVYTSFQEALMRVLVSDVEGTVLSSRIVDLDGLGELARGLMRRARER
jgi:DNA-binding NtrC family response regulator